MSLIKFRSGGTDFGPPLTMALNIMKKEKENF
jgi:hypothetical protein